MTYDNMLDYVLDKEAKKLVGKICKRFDLLFSKAKKEYSSTEIEELREQIRELSYEWNRDLKDTLGLIVKSVSLGTLGKELKNGS